VAEVSGSPDPFLGTVLGLNPALPAAITRAPGQPLFLSVGVRDTGSFIYNWYKNGTLLSPVRAGYSDPVYFISNLKTTDAGTYSVNVYKAGRLLASSSTIVTVNASAPVGSGEDAFTSGLSSRWSGMYGFDSHDSHLAAESGRLNYVMDKAGSANTQAFCLWDTPLPSAQNWEMQVDAYVVLGLSVPNYFSLRLGASAPTSATTSLFVNNGLEVAFDVSSSRRQIQNTKNMPQDPGWLELAPVAISSSTTLVGLKLSWNASTKTLTAYYDEDGPTGGYNWIQSASQNFSTLSASDLAYGFIPVLSGIAEPSFLMSSGEAYFDNFKVTIYQSYLFPSGGGAYASSTFAPAYPTSNAFDGNGATAWVSALTSGSAVLGYDFGSGKTLNTITLNQGFPNYTPQTHFATQVQVLGSNDNSTWTELGTFNTVYGNNTLNLTSPGSYRFYVLRAMNLPSGYWAVAEVSGSPSPFGRMRVFGKVVTSQNQPWAGLQLDLKAYGNIDSAETYASTTTGADGSFSLIADNSKYSYLVGVAPDTAVAKGFILPVNIFADPDRELLDLKTIVAEVMDKTIKVRLVDGVTGTPLSGADLVNASSPKLKISIEANSDNLVLWQLEQLQKASGRTYWGESVAVRNGLKNQANRIRGDTYGPISFPVNLDWSFLGSPIPPNLPTSISQSVYGGLTSHPDNQSYMWNSSSLMFKYNVSRSADYSYSIPASASSGDPRVYVSNSGMWDIGRFIDYDGSQATQAKVTAQDRWIDSSYFTGTDNVTIDMKVRKAERIISGKIFRPDGVTPVSNGSVGVNCLDTLPYGSYGSSIRTDTSGSFQFAVFPSTEDEWQIWSGAIMNQYFVEVGSSNVTNIKIVEGAEAQITGVSPSGISGQTLRIAGTNLNYMGGRWGISLVKASDSSWSGNYLQPASRGNGYLDVGIPSATPSGTYRISYYSIEFNIECKSIFEFYH
jgi:hypothetical protein